MTHKASRINRLGFSHHRLTRTRLGWCALALSALTLTQLAWNLTSPSLPPAYAQAITDDDVLNYARTVSEIEAVRLAARDEASNILGSEDAAIDTLETPLSCKNARLKDMPDISKTGRLELRTVLVEFCSTAKEIAETNGLTPKRFNSITAEHREDADLAERIKGAIADL